MGTSNSYGGPGTGTPLVPSWVDDGPAPTPSPVPPTPPLAAPPDGDGVPPTPAPDLPPAPANRPVVSPGAADRFTQPRSNFTKFVKSGGSDRSSLGKSLSGYVSSSSGGSRTAMRRMGSSRRALNAFANFLSDVQQRGAQAALKQLNLDSLAGKGIDEVFVGLIDYICPDGGNVDEGIARSAFIETIADIVELGFSEIDDLTSDQLQIVLEIFTARTIEERLCNDIGIKICIAAENIAEFEKVEQQVFEFIRRSVADAYEKANINLNTLTPAQATRIADTIYESAFSILQSLSESEADSE